MSFENDGTVRALNAPVRGSVADLLPPLSIGWTGPAGPLTLRSRCHAARLSVWQRFRTGPADLEDESARLTRIL